MVDAMHIAQWRVDPDMALGVLFKQLWETPADDDMLYPERKRAEALSMAKGSTLN